jgi:hypothetical protein
VQIQLLVGPLILSISGMAVAAATYVNRAKPEWQRHAGALMVIAIGQVILGMAVWLLFAQ